MVVVTILIMVLLTAVTVRIFLAHKAKSNTYQRAMTMKVLVSYVQMLMILHLLHADWPDALTDFIEVVQGSSGTTTVIGCIIGGAPLHTSSGDEQSFPRRFRLAVWTICGIPILVALLVPIVLSIMYLIWHPMREKDSSGKSQEIHRESRELKSFTLPKTLEVPAEHSPGFSGQHIKSLSSADAGANLKSLSKSRRPNSVDFVAGPAAPSIRKTRSLSVPVNIVEDALLKKKVKTLQRLDSIKEAYYSGSKPIAVFGIVIFFVWPSVLAEALELLACTKVDVNDTSLPYVTNTYASGSYLLTDTEIKCWTGQHADWAYGLAVPVLIACLLVPCIVYVYLRRHIKRFSEAGFSEAWGFIYIGYRRKRWYYEFFISLTKFLMTLIAIMTFDWEPMAQLLMAMSVMLVFLFLAGFLNPYELRLSNRMEQLSTYSQACLNSFFLRLISVSQAAMTCCLCSKL